MTRSCRRSRESRSRDWSRASAGCRLLLERPAGQGECEVLAVLDVAAVVHVAGGQDVLDSGVLLGPVRLQMVARAVYVEAGQLVLLRAVADEHAAALVHEETMTDVRLGLVRVVEAPHAVQHVPAPFVLFGLV